MAILDDTRADWNARPPLRPLTRVPWSERIGVSWHWLGDGKGPNVSGAHQKCLDQVRAWQGFHQQTRGWSDLGYNALVCQHGRAIEGRGLEYAGAHSPGVNTSHVGVQFMVGNGDPFPSALMLARAVRLRADLGYLGKNIRRDWGHRDDPKVSTECPGDGIHEWVHSGGPTTALTTQEDDDMQLTDIITVNEPDGSRTEISYGKLLNRMNYAYNATVQLLAGQAADQAANDAILKALTEDKAIDLDAIRAAAREGAQSLLDVQANVVISQKAPQ